MPNANRKPVIVLPNPINGNALRCPKCGADEFTYIETSTDYDHVTFAEVDKGVLGINTKNYSVTVTEQALRCDACEMISDLPDDVEINR